MKCGVCGNYPIFDVSVIRSDDGDKLNACNRCIDQITNRAVSGWFKTYRKKRKNIIENWMYIDGLSSILAEYEQRELPFQLTSGDVERLRTTFVQVCSGLNPGIKEKQLAECYISYTVE